VSLDYIEIEPPQKTKASVIWLHGLGADGNDFAQLVPALNIPEALAVRFIFPHAPFRSITLNDGKSMRGWYDIYGLDRSEKQDKKGIEETTQLIISLIEKENRRGVSSNKIILAGFSQGGAIALHAGLHYPKKLAGIMALSTYLPLHEAFGTKNEEANKSTPIFMAHGTQDDVLPFSFGELSKHVLEEHNYPVAWHPYNMRHSVCPQEALDISKWIQERLG